MVAKQVLERRRAVLRDPPVEFQLGQVVQHKIWDFRGAVYGWDSRPTVDVSQWEGVKGSKAGADQPFYYLLPDEQDCIAAFGAPRSSRCTSVVVVAQIDLDRIKHAR